jgi:HSP20 family protein
MNKIMNRHDLIKRDPFKEIREWERRLFNDPFFVPSLLEKDYWGEIMHTPSELTEDEKHYHLAIELPGMDKEKIKVEAGDKHLRIYGEKKEEKKPRENERRPHYSEFYYGSFSRDYHFPNSINKEQIQASYQKGILSLTIPKSAQSRLQQVEIK